MAVESIFYSVSGLSCRGALIWHEGVKAVRPLLLTAPGAPVSRAICGLAQRLAVRPTPAATGGMQFFFQRLIGEGRQ